MKDLEIIYSKDESMNIRMPDFVTSALFKENRSLLEQMMNYCANQLYYSQLTCANDLLQKFQEKGLKIPGETSMVYFDDYENGKSAMMSNYTPNARNMNSYQKIEINPCVRFESISLYGLTVMPGSMSDLIFYDNHFEGINAYTKDFLSIHHGIVTLFLEMYCKLIEEHIVNHLSLPADFEEFSKTDFWYRNEQYQSIKEMLRETLIQKLTKNRSVRLKQESIVRTFKECYINSQFSNTPNQIINAGIRLGKTPAQVLSFVDRLYESNIS